MRNGSITYKELADKLESVGYSQHRGRLEQRRARVFEHESIENATIFLPDEPDEDIVAPPFLSKVLLILRTHNLIEEKNPLLS